MKNGLVISRPHLLVHVTRTLKSFIPSNIYNPAIYAALTSEFSRKSSSFYFLPQRNEDLSHYILLRKVVASLGSINFLKWLFA